MGVFGLFLLLACTVMQIYVLWRAVSVPAITRRVSRKVLIAASVAPWLCLVFGRMLDHAYGGIAAAIVDQIGMDWLAALFLASFCLLIVDLVTVFGWLVRRYVAALRGAALLAGAALTVTALVQGLRPPVIREYTVRVAELPAASEGMTIVALADLHMGTLIGPRWLAARVAQVQRLHPDLVVLLGDLFEGHGRAPADLLPELRKLSAPLGVWAVPGNHESFGRETESQRVLQSAGIVMLSNRRVQLRPGLVLAGVEDLTMNSYFGKGTDPVAQTLEGRPTPSAVILLSHSPLRTEEAAAAGAGLMLCGHTHGGQIWPFNYLVQLKYPLMAGRYDVHGMPVIVSRGTGTWGPRMRLWRPGEILRITLRR